MKECIESGLKYSEIDMDSTNAKMAYERGCNSKDYYSCYRLGQYFEFKNINFDEALKFYKIACGGKDSYGCEGDYELHMKLCYEEEQRKYCGKSEPKGEYKIIAFLENHEPSHSDCFKDHNFSYSFKIVRTEKLFKKQVNEKNPKLLKIFPLF